MQLSFFRSFTPFVMIVRICVLLCVLHFMFIIISEVWNISHCSRLGHKTIECAVCHVMLLLLLVVVVFMIVQVQYIPRNMHTVYALLCFVVFIHWLIFPYPSGLLPWYCGNLTIAPVPAKQPWWIWMNTSREFIMNDCITTTKQSTTKPCAYFLG